MTDPYENIRKALAMGPTPGPWSEYANHRLRPYIAGADGSLIAFIESDDDVEDANAAHIAACDPDTIRELLAERDAATAIVAELCSTREGAAMVAGLVSRKLDHVGSVIDAAIAAANGGGND